MLSANISTKFKNSELPTPSIDTSRPSRDPYISLFQIPTLMSESSLRVFVLSLSILTLIWTWHWTTWNTQTLVNQARNWMSWLILLLFANSWYFGVILIGASMRQRAFIKEGRLKQLNSVKEAFIWEWASIRSFTVLDTNGTRYFVKMAYRNIIHVSLTVFFAVGNLDLLFNCVCWPGTWVLYPLFRLPSSFLRAFTFLIKMLRLNFVWPQKNCILSPQVSHSAPYNITGKR